MQDSKVRVLDHDGDELADMPGTDLDELAGDHEPAAGVDTMLDADGAWRQRRRGSGVAAERAPLSLGSSSAGIEQGRAWA